MQFFKLLSLASTLAVASAAVQFTNTAAELTGIAVGKPLTIKWAGATGTVTINLKSGPSTAQTFVETIVSGATATSFTWTPEKTLPDATYNLEITDGTVTNYSVQFEITGGTAATSTAGSFITSVASTSGSSVSVTAASSSSTAAASSSTGSSTLKSSSTSKSSASSTSASSSTSSTASIPTSNSAVQNGSPFALVILGALALAGLN